MEFIRDVRYEESVWMKVRGGRGKEALYLCCVYMPTEGSAAAVIEDGYERLKEDVLEYQQKGRVVLLGDFNARVGKSTDIGMSDHFLVWLELGRTAKNSRKQKRTIRRWRLDKFGDDVVREKYCEALQAEVEAFSEGISQMEEGGMKGNELVEGVLKEWESVVNKVARDTVGEKVIVCGRSVRWWDDEIKTAL